MLMGGATYMAKTALQVIIFRRSWTDCQRAQTLPSATAQTPSVFLTSHPTPLQWRWARPKGGERSESRYCQRMLEPEVAQVGEVSDLQTVQPLDLPSRAGG